MFKHELSELQPCDNVHSGRLTSRSITSPFPWSQLLLVFTLFSWCFFLQMRALVHIGCRGDYAGRNPPCVFWSSSCLAVSFSSGRPSTTLCLCIDESLESFPSGQSFRQGILSRPGVCPVPWKKQPSWQLGVSEHPGLCSVLQQQEGGDGGAQVAA